APNSINIESSYTFDSGELGFTTIGAVNRQINNTPVPNSRGSVKIADGVTLTAIGGEIPTQFYGNINISAPVISFGANTSIVSENNSITNIKLASNHFDANPVGLTVTLPDSSSANMVTGTGIFLISLTLGTPRMGNLPALNTPLTFVKSDGAGITALNVTGGQLRAVFSSSTIIGDNIGLTSTDRVVLATASLALGANSSVASSLTSGTAIALISGSAAPYTITLPDGFSVTMSTGGGSFLIAPATSVTADALGQTLTFAKSGITGSTTLYLNGRTVLLNTNNDKNSTTASITIPAGVTLSSDSGITMNVNNSTLINNGTVQTSGGSSITVQSNGSMTVSGSGSFQTAGTASFLATTAGSMLTI